MLVQTTARSGISGKWNKHRRSMVVFQWILTQKFLVYPFQSLVDFSFGNLVFDRENVWFGIRKFGKLLYILLYYTILVILITNFLVVFFFSLKLNENQFSVFENKLNLRLYFHNNKILFVRIYKEQTFRKTRTPVI